MDAPRERPAAPVVRLLTYNLQVGIRTSGFRDYVTQSWRHALPGRTGPADLREAARIVRGYDFVALQEADAGSLRTRFTNQVDLLAADGGFPYHGLAVTRDLRPVARHCIGFLSRWPARVVGDHALPGPVPGRRALHVKLELPAGELSVLIVHLSLGAASQRRQIDHVVGLTSGDEPSVIMGDFNCEPDALLEHPALRRAGFLLPPQRIDTYPSWAPRRSLDHIVVSPHLEFLRAEALGPGASDHLPVHAQIAFRQAGAP